ncbi:MAG: hypothetical protein JNK82_33635 [Myxococcaceae bacterium]|nr:hypothetical protein [Myxococcaceae bacterium]
MLVWLTAAAVLSASTPALHVEKSGDARLPCAANAALEQAVKVRLPRVRLAKGRAVGGDLVAQISSSGGGFRFEVRKADGSVAMSRDLFSGCAQLGDTSALILERYLAQIAWSGREAGLVAPSPPMPKPQPETRPESLPPPPVVEVEPLDAGATDDLLSRIGVTPEPTGAEPISAPSPVASPPPDAGSPQPAAPVIRLPPEPPRGSIVTAVEVSAAGGLWYLDRPVGGLSLDLGVTLRERVRLGLFALTGTPVKRGDPEGRGTLESLDFGAFVSLGVCTKTVLQLCGSAFGGARFTWAQATTTEPPDLTRLFQVGSGVITVPELGASGRLSYAIASRFLIALQLLFGVPLIRGALVVKGFDPFLNPLVDAAALLHVGVRL